MLFVLALTALSISTNFEGGSLGKVERVSENHYRCAVIGETDQNHRNRQASWYYFRVDHAVNRDLTFDMVDLAGEYNFKPTAGSVTRDTPPFYSFDRETWIPVEDSEFHEEGPSLSFTIHSTSQTVWIAHVPPYTNQNLDRLLKDLARKSAATVTSIGKTLEGRPIRLVTITDPAVPDSAKKILWFIFRQHAWEAGSSWMGEGLIRFAVSKDPTAAAIRKGTMLKILPLCDPDGVAHGGVRFNRRGFDLNRNWDVRDPVNMPEIDAERRALLAGRVDAFVTIHNTETNETLTGPPVPFGAARPLLERFYEAFSAGSTFAPSAKPLTAPVTTTEGIAGRMNVVQGLYHDRQIPAFEIEMRVAAHPKLGHRPLPEDRLRAGRELLLALWSAMTK